MFLYRFCLTILSSIAKVIENGNFNPVHCVITKKWGRNYPRNSLSAVGIIIFRSYLYSGSGRTEVDRDKFRCRRFQKSEISLWDNFICETLKHFYLYCQKRHCCWLVFFTLRDISHGWLKFFKARAKVQNCFFSCLSRGYNFNNYLIVKLRFSIQSCKITGISSDKNYLIHCTFHYW